MLLTLIACLQGTSDLDADEDELEDLRPGGGKIAGQSDEPIRDMGDSDIGNPGSVNRIHAEDVCKTYTLTTGKKLKAVQNLYMGVPAGQIFGLLGPNGAGKTTMISMLVGTETVDSGDAWICDKSIVSEEAEARASMGVCPQFDALTEALSAREMLKVFSMIRGVPDEIIPDLVENSIKQMGMVDKASQQCVNYSGGNKRKLSVALSMLASPKVVFLDEPSTGMDPDTRRFMWDLMQKLVTQEDKAFVLTTHSMEEADALCGRIGIMTRGVMRTVGTSTELKARHGTGFIVDLRVSDNADADAVDDLIRSVSPNMTTEPTGLSVKKYEVPQTDTKMGAIFAAILGAQEKLGITDFSVSQTTLEDVFIRFAKVED